MKPKRIIFFSLLLLLIIAWSIFVYVVGVDNVANSIGVSNGYMLSFLMALFGGSSTFTSFAYIATIITLSIGGLSTIKLALIGGVGLFIGDILYFIVARYGNFAFSHNKAIYKLAKFINKSPSWAISTIVYLYFCSPFPNDVITVRLGLGKCSYRKMVLPLLLGNITFIFWVSFLAKKGVNLVN